MQDSDFVDMTSHRGILCPLPRSKPAQFNRYHVKWDFEQLHKTYFEVEDITCEEGLSREQLVLSMRFFCFIKHHDLKMFAPNSHTIFFYCAQMGEPLFKYSKK